METRVPKNHVTVRLLFETEKKVEKVVLTSTYSNQTIQTNGQNETILVFPNPGEGEFKVCCQFEDGQELCSQGHYVEAGYSPTLSIKNDEIETIDFYWAMNPNYKDIFKETRRLVNEWDPCSFIEAGAPKDEYDALTNKILGGVINERETEQLRNEVIELFANYYGTPVFDELSTERQELLKNDIKELIEKIEKTNANKTYKQ